MEPRVNQLERLRDPGWAYIELRPSTLKLAGQGTGRSNAYAGVLRPDVDDAKAKQQVWWRCGHKHDNRDNDNVRYAAARTCAEYALALFNAGDRTDTIEGVHDLNGAAPGTLDWLSQRERAVNASKVGNRRAYPETWVEVGDERFRGKLYEKETDGELARRLYVAGPFGQDSFIDAYLDLDTREVHTPDGNTLIPLGWQQAVVELEATVGQWATGSQTAAAAPKDHQGMVAPSGQQLSRDGLSLPARYRVRVNAGPPRSYDIVEVNSETVVEEGLSRVAAYRKAKELNGEVERRVEVASHHWTHDYLYEGTYLANSNGRCNHCSKVIVPEEAAWFSDHIDGGGPFFCSQDCGREALVKHGREAVREDFLHVDSISANRNA